MTKEIEKRKLTPKQELFCKLYASDREFFGNGVQSYIEAYNIDMSKKGQYSVAKIGAYENLTKPYLLGRINELMDIMVNDIVVDKELAFTIMQKGNLSAKVQAIREYNLLKARIKQAQVPQTNPIIIILKNDGPVFPTGTVEGEFREGGKDEQKTD